MYCSHTVCSSMRFIAAAQCGHERVETSAKGLVSARDTGPTPKDLTTQLHYSPVTSGTSVAVCALDHTEKWM